MKPNHLGRSFKPAPPSTLYPPPSALPSAALALALLISAAAGAATLQKKVLIIGIDGTMPSALAVARTPNLNWLRSNGCYSDRVVTDPVTHSAACWSSFFTGVWGDKHGVQDPGNSFAGNRFNLYPSFMRRLETANSNLNTVVFARWAPLTNVTTGSDVMQAFDTDAAITTATCQRLTNANPDVLYMILLDVDSTGHSSGWGANVTNYVKSIETADTRVGVILNALTNRATYAAEDWLVISLSDHGQHDSTVERSRMTFHVLSGPSVARGPLLPTPSIVDLSHRILGHMGVAVDFGWNLDVREEGRPAPPTRFGTNLILNGDAEWNSGTNDLRPDRGIAWWWDTLGTTLGCYGSNGRFPAATHSGPTNRGLNFFLGGTNTATSITQTLGLADIASQTDDPGVDFELSGWFGGWAAETDSASLTARFYNVTNLLLGLQTVGPVTVTDRAGLTGLWFRSATGRVPVGTRSVEFTLAFSASSITNDGSADNLSFTLTARQDPVLRIDSLTRSNQTWRLEFRSLTNRFYTLQRSRSLLDWSDSGPEVAGTGQSLGLTDTNSPPDHAFYRVQVRKP